MKEDEPDRWHPIAIRRGKGERGGERSTGGLGIGEPGPHLADRVRVEVADVERHRSIVDPGPGATTAILIVMSASDPPPRPRAVLFDLDGTLVDTVPARIRAWREVLAEHGLPTTDDALAPMIGIDGRRLAREAAAAAGRELEDHEAEVVDREAGERFDAYNDRPRPLPGAGAAIARLERAGVPWAIATSSRAAQVAGSVGALGLDREPRIIDGSRVRHAKPAPDLLILAADEMGFVPAHVWYVGDATWDMAAAVAAGMRPIAVLAGSAVDAGELRRAGAVEVHGTLDELVLPG